jgi:ADP-glucose pyrophosphorylase
MMEYWDISRTALIFPTDSIIDFDLEPMYRAHIESGAVATIAAMTRAPAEVAEKYGVMLTDPRGHILEFVEKPTLAELRDHFQVSEEDFERLPLLTNAGFYMIDSRRLRDLTSNREIAELRRKRMIPVLTKIRAKSVSEFGDYQDSKSNYNSDGVIRSAFWLSQA